MTINELLASKVRLLNAMTMSPREPFSPGPDYKPQAGNYHLYHADNKVALHRTTGTGGEEDVIGIRGTKKQMVDWLDALIAGIRIGRSL